MFNGHLPGFHEEIPAEEYHTEIDAGSQSALKELARGKSPRQVRHGMTTPSPSTPTMAFGTAFHSVLLEGADVKTGPTKTRASKAWKEMEAEFPGETIVTPDEAVMLDAMYMSVRNFPPAASLLDQPGPREGTGLLVYTAHDGDRQGLPELLPVKVRPDLYIPALATIVDVKTTTDASREAFEKSIFNFGYHQQGGFYRETLRRLDMPVDHFVIIAVEKSPPYEVAVYRLTDEVLNWGWRSLEEAMRIMALCFGEDHWPTFPDEVQDIELPDWAMRKLEREN